MKPMVHAFTFDDTNIVLDVNSNTVHVVDEPAFKLIQSYPGAAPEQLRQQYGPVYGQDVVQEILVEIQDLISQGLLYAPDPLPGGYQPQAGDAVKALCLHLAHDCNLRCRYCFAGQGDFGGPRGLMSQAVGRRALDFLMEVSGSRRHVEVDFFGGEPLLNKPVMEDLVQYGRERARRANKEIKFTLTTNALLLDDETQRFVGENQLAVVLSIDGRPQVHDNMRPFPGGRGSYATVMDRIRRFVASPHCDDYYVRGTFTRHNLDFARDVIHLIEAGFDRVSVEPVVAPQDMDYALREQDVPGLLEEYDSLTRYLLARHNQGRPVDFFHFNIDLEQGPCLPKRLTGCSAGSEYLAVTPEGDLYPCHQFVGREEYKMGHVFGGFRNQIACQFQNAHIYNKDQCRQCWAKFNCSGGCHVNALNFNGNLLEPYGLGCLLARKRLECAIYLKVCAGAQ